MRLKYIYINFFIIYNSSTLVHQFPSSMIRVVSARFAS